MGQHFDRLCSAVERHWKSAVLRDHVKRAKLFDFPGRVHEVVSMLDKSGKRLSDYSAVGGVDFVMENFFLPFPVVAVEDTASCIVIVDREEDQRGLNATRMFIECYAANTSTEEFGYDGHTLGTKYVGDRAQLPKDASIVIVSKLTGARKVEVGGRAPIEYVGELGLMLIVSKRQGLLIHPQEFMVSAKVNGTWECLTESAMRNAITALEEVMYFNTPDRFVVRQHPKRVSKKGAKRATEFLRSDEREHYILLRPEEIRERFGIPDEPVQDRKAPRPHSRRRHYRTLRSERYKEARGKTVVVPATWVGPESGEYKGRRYEVCLDL